MNYSDLEKLAELKEKGVLSEEEFEAEKEKILNTLNQTSDAKNEMDKNKKDKQISKHMKACKTCKNLIDKKASICPFCGREDKTDQVAAGIILFIFFVVVSVFIGNGLEKDIANDVILKDNFTLESMKASKDEFGIGLYIEGNIKNNTNRKYTYVQVTFNLYDKDGLQLGTAMANINYLEPNGTWKYKAIGLISDASEVDSCKLVEITGF